MMHARSVVIIQKRISTVISIWTLHFAIKFSERQSMFGPELVFHISGKMLALFKQRRPQPPRRCKSGAKRHRRPDDASKLLGDGFERVLRVGAILGAAEVRQHDHRAPRLARSLRSGRHALKSRRVGHLAVLGRHVEVGTHEHALALDDRARDVVLSLSRFMKVSSLLWRAPGRHRLLSRP